MITKRAIILAGGKGTRLKPYTIVFPKPLVPINEMPILEIVIRQLSSHGFNHITMAVNHLSELIQAFFGDGSKWGIKIDYSLEHKPLSTMGPLRLIPDLPENFLIMNGDVLTDLNYQQLYHDHVKNGNVFTISAYQRNEKIDYGVLEVDEKSQLAGFKEKPNFNFDVSMGVYIANRRILDFIPQDQAFGFDNLMYDLLKNEIPVFVKKFAGIWLDIGRPEDYASAIDVFEKERNKFLPDDKK
jgi:NDP-sugar pyrophosphorylase family protein